MSARRIALAGVGFRQRAGQFLPQPAEFPFDPAFAADQDMIVIRQPFLWQRIAEQFTEPPLHPVADHRVADLLGDGNAESLALPLVGVSQQNETGTCNTQAPVRGKEIGAAGQYRQVLRAGSRPGCYRCRIGRFRRSRVGPSRIRR